MFFSKKTAPSVSVCIPVYKTEGVLSRCLESVAAQDFDAIEIIVVDDCSPGKDERGRSCKSIAAAFKKQCKIPLVYIRHERNKGLLEARRTAVFEASGTYIMCLDSDDRLLPGAVRSLYSAALESKADIVQGRANVFSEGSASEQRIQSVKEKIKVHEGILFGKEIMSDWLLSREHSCFLWGRLISRECYLNALESIPPVWCTMAEDVLQYFFIALNADSYCGINAAVYDYCVDQGISSCTKIEDLARWEKVCSASSVFTVIFSYLDEHPSAVSDSELLELKKMCLWYVKNNLEQLNATVPEELKPAALEKMYDYWGRSLVEEVQFSDSIQSS